MKKAKDMILSDAIEQCIEAELEIRSLKRIIIYLTVTIAVLSVLLILGGLYG